MNRLKFLLGCILVTCSILLNVDKTYAGIPQINYYVYADIPYSWNSDDYTELFFDLKQTDVNIEDVYGTRIRFTVSDESKGFGGAVAWNGFTCGWQQTEWGNSDSGKEIIAENTGKAGEYFVTIKSPEQVFFQNDTKDNCWAQIVVTSWWGGSINVKQIELLDVNGNILYTTGDYSNDSNDVPYTDSQKIIITALFFTALLVLLLLKINLIHRLGGNRIYEHQDKAKAI